MEILSIPAKNSEPDYFQLCAYVNFNANQLFYYNREGSHLEGVFSVPDDEMIIDEFAEPQYSGVYFRQFYVINEDKTISQATDIKKIIRFNQDNLPPIIYTGTMSPCATGLSFSGPEKLIFKNGVYFDPGQDEKPTY